ncbi:head-tail joining protein [uncultured Paracoccus sp.]|uniref:head-tail joining protein n=1 Tax=uncultured Paracoccus sp. TaxID=189685 RepID=UPI0025F7E50C|nr:head-tail joining protein [uncultured Paracoccus sp.]
MGAFLSTDDFAVTATIYPRDGAPRAVSVIFDDPFASPSINGYDVETVQPTASGRASDFAGVRKGDEIEIAGVRYVLDSGPRDDGTGWAALPLYRADGR